MVNSQIGTTVFLAYPTPNSLKVPLDVNKKFGFICKLTKYIIINISKTYESS